MLIQTYSFISRTKPFHKSPLRAYFNHEHMKLGQRIRWKEVRRRKPFACLEWIENLFFYQFFRKITFVHFYVNSIKRFYRPLNQFSSTAAVRFNTAHLIIFILYLFACLRISNDINLCTLGESFWLFVTIFLDFLYLLIS